MGGDDSKDRQLATQQYEHHTWVTAKHPRTRQQWLVPPLGLEPRTHGLKVRCSAN